MVTYIFVNNFPRIHKTVLPAVGAWWRHVPIPLLSRVRNSACFPNAGFCFQEKLASYKPFNYRHLFLRRKQKSFPSVSIG